MVVAAIPYEIMSIRQHDATKSGQAEFG